MKDSIIIGICVIERDIILIIEEINEVVLE